MTERNTLSPLLFLLLVFSTGTGIMIIELVGPRLLAPSFGSSLIVWTSIITVTLISLAIGYECGGVIADKWPNPRPLFMMIGISGAWTAALPFLSNPVLLMTSGMGDMGGSLTSALILFLVPITLLAMVGPYVIRLLTDAVRNVGHKVGAVTAISTVGSVVGSIATGFFLIPYLGLDVILYGTATVLVLISVIGLLGTRNIQAIIPVALFAALGFASALSGESTRNAVLKDEGFNILYERTTPYADVKVVDQSMEFELKDGRTVTDELRFMFIGLGGHTLLINGDYNFGYVRPMHLAPTIRDNAKTACILGLGGGSIVRAYTEVYGMEVDTVEIDPWVVEAARDHFGIIENEKSRIHVGDARRFLIETDKTFDIIVNDAFGGGTAPFHLFSQEMLDVCKERLSEDGILVMNYLGFTEAPLDVGAASILKTIQSKFEFVRMCRGEELKLGKELIAFEELVGSDSRTFTNIIFFASRKAFELEVPGYVKPQLGDQIQHLLSAPVELDPSHGQIVTDLLNPLDRLNTHQNRIQRIMALKYFRPVFLGTASPKMP